MNAATASGLYRSVFQHGMEAVFLITADGAVLAANPAACRLFGLNEQTLCSRRIDTLIDTAGPAYAAFVEEQQRQGRARGELTCLRDRGEAFPAEVSAEQFLNDQAQPRITLIIRDLTAHRRTEQALSESRLLLESLVNSTDDMIWSFDPASLTLLWFNAAFAAFFAQRGLQVRTGMPLGEILSDESRIGLWQGLIRDTLARGRLTAEITTPEENRTLALKLNVLAREGKIHGISAFARDITEIRESRLKLARSEANYRSVINAMAEGVVFQDAEGRILDLNPAAERIEGRTREAMLGRFSDDPAWDAVREDGTPFPGDEHPSMVTLRTGEPRLNVVMGIRTPDDDRRWISINSEPVFHADAPRPHAVVTTFHDITAQKQAQQKIADYVRQLEKSMRQTLQAVSNMVEMRDPYTAGHKRRVGLIARDIAREMGWPETRCQELELVGLVHDIGKIAIPGDILTKPSRLNALEYKLVQTHVEYSYEILKDVEFSLPIAEIIYQHHERMDGSGYPRGLSGDRICPEARILAVADVLESMATHRPYRPALGMETAIAEIVSHRGSWFDPEVVDAMLCLVHAKGYRLPA